MLTYSIGGDTITIGAGSGSGVSESAYQANEEYYQFLGALANAYAGDGIIEIDGEEVDVQTLTGSAYVTAELQIQNSILETINNLLKYIQNYEKTLASSTS